MRALGRAVRAVTLVAGEVAAQELLGAAGVGVAARQRDALLKQPLGEYQPTAVEGDKKPLGRALRIFLSMNDDVRNGPLISFVMTCLLLPREARHIGHTLI